jgi:hypothetical protein
MHNMIRNKFLGIVTKLIAGPQRCEQIVFTPKISCHTPLNPGNLAHNVKAKKATPTLAQLAARTWPMICGLYLQLKPKRDRKKSQSMLMTLSAPLFSRDKARLIFFLSRIYMYAILKSTPLIAIHS